MSKKNQTPRNIPKCGYMNCSNLAENRVELYLRDIVKCFDPFYSAWLCKEHIEHWTHLICTGSGNVVARDIANSIRGKLLFQENQHQRNLNLINKGTRNKMPIPFSITKDDLLRSKLVTPGWYTLRIKNITQGPGKKDENAMTTRFDFEIVDGALKEFIGVPISHWLSEKAPGMAIPLLQALSGKKMDENGMDLDLEKAIGKNVKGYVKNEPYMNRMTNKISDFASI